MKAWMIESLNPLDGEHPDAKHYGADFQHGIVLAEDEETAETKARSLGFDPDEYWVEELGEILA